MIFPTFPKPGDVLGIAAPSAGVGHKLESFDESLARLRARGYEIVETASVRNDSDRSASAEVRGREFSELLADDRVRAVLSASGGDYNIEMLPYLDVDPLLRTPKWIAGASDPTNILYYLTTTYDVATLYGFNAGSFDGEVLHPFQERALDILGGNLVKQESFEFCDSNRDFDLPSSYDTPVSWDLYLPNEEGRKAANQHLDVSGRLIGGCIDCISKLIGTPYDGTSLFVNRYEDIVWYFDNFAMSAFDLYLTLVQMSYAGYFRHAKAVLFGRTLFTKDIDEDYTSLIARVLKVPFLWNADIGHVKPCFTLINGAMAHVIHDEGKGSLTMELR